MWHCNVTTIIENATIQFEKFDYLDLAVYGREFDGSYVKRSQYFWRSLRYNISMYFERYLCYHISHHYLQYTKVVWVYFDTGRYTKSQCVLKLHSIYIRVCEFNWFICVLRTPTFQCANYVHRSQSKNGKTDSNSWYCFDEVDTCFANVDCFIL